MHKKMKQLTKVKKVKRTLKQSLLQLTKNVKIISFVINFHSVNVVVHQIKIKVFFKLIKV